MTFQAAGLMVTNGHDVNAYRFADTNLSASPALEIAHSAMYGFKSADGRAMGKNFAIFTRRYCRGYWRISVIWDILDVRSLATRTWSAKR